MKRTPVPAAIAQPGYVDVPTTSANRTDFPWWNVALAMIGAGAGALNLSNLGVNGWGNQYYAAAVRSMLQSWQAFRYACFDPACLVTVDKPPLAFWLETASAHLLGFGSMALLGPSALAGTLSVVFLGSTVRRAFGRPAGLIAAIVLALTPVTVVTSRSNNPDAMLVLLVVLGVWAAVHALQSEHWRWAALTAVLFGLGFLTKMLAAFLVVPAVVLAYLVCAPTALRTRLAAVVSGGAIVAIVAFGWMLSVDLTPASARPWVGSSADNTELSLAFSSNGIQRIFGFAAPGSDRTLYISSGPGTAVVVTSGTGAPAGTAAAAAMTSGAGAATAAGAAFGGPAGFDRLLTGILAAQASWLLPLAGFGLVSALMAVRRGTRCEWWGGLIIFGGWTALVWAVFSFAGGIFHPYYLAELAPGIAALVGVGSVALVGDVRAGGGRILLPAVAIAGTGLFEWSIARSVNASDGWPAALLAISGAAAVLLTVVGLSRRVGAAAWPARVSSGAFGVGFAALLLTAASWSIAAPIVPANGMIPMAQAPQAIPARNDVGLAEGVDANRLLAFLGSNAGQQQFLLATNSPPIGGIVDTLIAHSGRNIIPLGGFGRRGGPLTKQQLADWVTEEQLRYFLLIGGFEDPLVSDIRRLCPAVPASTWGGSVEPRPAAGPDTLYDCRGKGGELLAAAAVS